MYVFQKGDFVTFKGDEECPRDLITLAVVVEHTGRDVVLVEVLQPKYFEGHDGDGRVGDNKGWYVSRHDIEKVNVKPNPALVAILGGYGNE